MSSSIRDVLVAARAMIADKRHWVKGTMSTHLDGTPVIDPRSRLAECFCMSGAVVRTVSDLDASIDTRSKVYAFLRRQIGQHTIVANFNDSSYTSHQDVLDAFDRAIEAAER